MVPDAMGLRHFKLPTAAVRGNAQEKGTYKARKSGSTFTHSLRGTSDFSVDMVHVRSLGFGAFDAYTNAYFSD